MKFIDKRYKMTIPNLKEKMLEADATYVELAEASGVNKSTVHRALMGKSILLKNGQAMIEALNTRKFKRNYPHMGDRHWRNIKKGKYDSQVI